MADAIAVQLAKTGQITSTPDLQGDGRVAWEDSNVPIWTKMGFGNDRAAYEARYGQVPTKTGIPSYLNQLIGEGSGTSTPATPPAVPPTWAEYLKQNPDGGDAFAYVSLILREYGLETLEDWAQKTIMNDLSPEQVVQQMREQDAYKTRFKAIIQRKESGLPPVSEAEVLNYEKQATQMMRSAGLPQGFWDEPDDFVNLQTRDVSLAELDSRINKGYLAVMQSPQDVRDQWSTLGYNTGDMVAYFLDPTRTEAVLTKQLASTQRAAEAQRTGFGQLSTLEAEDLAGLGIQGNEAQQGFSTLVKSRELFGSLPGENGQDITREQQLNAIFRNDVAAQQTIERRAGERVAQFAGGGTFTQSNNGRTGVGQAV